jgi:hypothetical protein
MRIFARLAALAAGFFIAATAAHATVSIRIDLSSQRMHVSNSMGENYTWAISSGRAGYITPRGTYRPYSLRRMHYSSKYNNSPMPYSIFFRGGYAIHGTSYVGMLGRPASHGCIRLATGNAAKLFGMVKREGAVITITGAPRHEMVAQGKQKRTLVAGKRAKKNTAVAARRAKANPMAYAPTTRAKAPTVRQFQTNPAGRW